MLYDAETAITFHKKRSAVCARTRKAKMSLLDKAEMSASPTGLVIWGRILGRVTMSERDLQRILVLSEVISERRHTDARSRSTRTSTR